MNQPAVSVISLGCAKNLVDTEGVLAALAERDWLIAAEPKDADLILINTCGFIEDAREESFQVIEGALALKARHVVKAVVVFGCLVQLLREQLPREFGQVDAWVGLAEPGAVAEACNRALSKPGKAPLIAPDPALRPIDPGPRLRITPRHYAYLRIAEGCDNRCHYCQIPRIRGPLRSKPAERVLAEARDLIADGARELLLIAQDATAYGTDLYGEPRLAPLIRQLRTLDGLVWLRLLYAHPAHVTDDLIALLAERGPVLPYLDLPVQHASDRILARMGRPVTKDALRRLIARLRAAVPDLTLRTSFIVGFPGETEPEFAELLDFVREVRFERLGAFAYSHEPATRAAEYGDSVPAGVKQERLAALMSLARDIATEQGAALVGSEIDAVVDGRAGDGEWAGRTVRDAPDIDGIIKFENPALAPGSFGPALVTDAYGYDLTGKFLPHAPNALSS